MFENPTLLLPLAILVAWCTHVCGASNENVTKAAKDVSIAENAVFDQKQKINTSKDQNNSADNDLLTHLQQVLDIARLVYDGKALQ